MFTFCEMMKWNHLPVEGGIYAQDPDLLEGFQYIFARRAEYQEQEEKRREQATTKHPGGKGRVAGRR